MASESRLFDLQQTGLGIEENHLRVVRARFVETEPFRMDLFDGFQSLRVLTYSVSVLMIVRMLDRFEHVECVFGHEGILHGVAPDVREPPP